ncbi:hypothetical protein B0H13DRAFT_2341373 [Mycena leptocephala]|nr:hypothetical protein B0H13DRAFT_2341373 [Mycena leptocephala]
MSTRSTRHEHWRYAYTQRTKRDVHAHCPPVPSTLKRLNILALCIHLVHLRLRAPQGAPHSYSDLHMLIPPPPCIERSLSLSPHRKPATVYASSHTTHLAYTHLAYGSAHIRPP